MPPPPRGAVPRVVPPDHNWLPTIGAQQQQGLNRSQSEQEEAQQLLIGQLLQEELTGRAKWLCSEVARLHAVAEKKDETHRAEMSKKDESFQNLLTKKDEQLEQMRKEKDEQYRQDMNRLRLESSAAITKKDEQLARKDEMYLGLLAKKDEDRDRRLMQQLHAHGRLPGGQTNVPCCMQI